MKNYEKNTIAWLNAKIWYRLIKVLFILFAFVFTAILIFFIVILSSNYQEYYNDFSNAKIVCNYGNRNIYNYKDVIGLNLNEMDYLELCGIHSEQDLPKQYHCDKELSTVLNIIDKPTWCNPLDMDLYHSLHFNNDATLRYYGNSDNNLLFYVTNVDKKLRSNLPLILSAIFIALIIELFLLIIIKRAFYFIVLGSFYPKKE